jgi:hypothetical protein
LSHRRREERVELGIAGIHSSGAGPATATPEGRVEGEARIPTAIPASHQIQSGETIGLGLFLLAVEFAHAAALGLELVIGFEAGRDAVADVQRLLLGSRDGDHHAGQGVGDPVSLSEDGSG